MKSIDGKYDFDGFMLQNNSFQENFSIGLYYNINGEKGGCNLLRCNGPHGGNKEITHHFYCHIHTVIAEDLNNGIMSERNILITDSFATFEDAIQFYIKRINLKLEDRVKHFPPPSGQIEFNFTIETEV